MEIYAKSKPIDNPETLLEHTKTLLCEFNKFKGIYGNEIISLIPGNYKSIFWQLLELIILYHDLGKIHTPFQIRIIEDINRKRKKYNIPPLDTIPLSEIEEIPHNLLSPAFLKDVVKQYPKEIHPVIYQVIAYHHDSEREENFVIDTENWGKVIDAIEKDIKPNIHRLQSFQNELKLFIPINISGTYLKKISPRITKSDRSLYHLYLFLKGLLHRIDHSASAHLEIERQPLLQSESKITEYLSSKKVFNIWQKPEATNLSNKNTILVASTGIGKTEYALYWLNSSKGFYVLPVRTSVTAMYERIKEMFGEENIGLLHSDAYFYPLEQKETKKIDNIDSNSEGVSVTLNQFYATRQLSMPLTVSTADQLFPAVLKYWGYEKIYATLGYSKLIIDEIQSYDPQIAAIILEGLKEISKIGGRFCIVTATLPDFYKEYLTKEIPNIELPSPKIPKISKHKVRMLNIEKLQDCLPHFTEAYKKYKHVLVVVNTVKRAQELYDLVKDIPVYLLHSAFTYEDRRKKEGLLLDENNPPPEGIWIATQLVEVSLDINFPILFTEICSLDALVQRMGRVLRKEKSEGFKYEGEPNIWIIPENLSSGIGSIYDNTLVNQTKEIIVSNNGNLWSEHQKQEMMKILFNSENIKNTRYFDKFKKSLDIIKSGIISCITRKDAQDIFRPMANITVIPKEVYQQNFTSIDDALENIEKSRIKEQKISALYTLKKYSVSVPYYKVKNNLIPYKSNIFLVDLKYSPEKGLIPSKVTDPFL